MAWGKLLALRSFIAVLLHQDYEKGLELVAEALQALPEDQPHWRVIALWAMAESLERTTNIAEAIAAFREARQTGLALDNQIFVATVEISLALALNNYGQRREAVALCEEAIERYTDELGRPAQDDERRDTVNALFLIGYGRYYVSRVPVVGRVRDETLGAIDNVMVAV